MLLIHCNWNQLTTTAIELAHNNQDKTCPTDSSNSVGSASLSLRIFFLDVYIFTTVGKEENLGKAEVWV